MSNKEYNNLIENEYFSLVREFDNEPSTTVKPLENVSYGNNLYLYGSESLDKKIRLLEDNFVDYLNDWYQSSIKEDINIIAILISLENKLKRLLNDDLRKLKMIEWKNNATNFQVLYNVSYELRQEKEYNRRSYQFFWECLSSQMGSAERVLKILINLKSPFKKEELNDSSSFFKTLLENDLTKFDEVTITLRKTLIQSNLISNKTSLSDLRDLFDISSRKVKKNLVPIIWQENYVALSYFIKMLKNNNIIYGDNIYKTSIKRFRNKNNEEFSIKKERSDGKPKREVVTKIDNIFAEIKSYKPDDVN